MKSWKACWVPFRNTVLAHYCCYWETFESRALTHYSCYWGSYWSKVLTLYSCNWGSIESRVLTHWNCYWRPPWKQSTYTLQLLLGDSFKAEYLQIAVAIVHPFESWVPARYSCCWGPFQCRVSANYSCCWWPLSKQVLTFDLLRSILYEWLLRFPPKQEKFTREIRGGGFYERWARGKCLACLPLKHTTGQTNC